MRRRRFLTWSSALAAAGVVPATAVARRLFPADVTDRYVAWQGERTRGRSAGHGADSIPATADLGC